MKAITVIVGFATGLLISSACHPQEGPAKPPELKVLERFVGTWDSRTVGKLAEWTPQGVNSTGTNKYEWVLDGRFMQDTERNADGSLALGWWTYDTVAKAYRGWFFLSDGSVVEWKGSWDEDGKGLQVEANMGNGVVLRGRREMTSKIGPCLPGLPLGGRRQTWT